MATERGLKDTIVYEWFIDCMGYWTDIGEYFHEFAVKMYELASAF